MTKSMSEAARKVLASYKRNPERVLEFKTRKVKGKKIPTVASSNKMQLLQTGYII